MISNKLLWTAAAIVLPLGIANAQVAEPVDSSAAPVEQAAPATDAGLTSGPEATATETTTTADSSTAGDAAAAITGSAPVAVAQADVTKGATVHGSDGQALGTVESVTAEAAVISTGKAKAQIPFASIGKNDKGLVIAMSKSQFEDAVAGKSAS